MRCFIATTIFVLLNLIAYSQERPLINKKEYKIPTISREDIKTDNAGNRYYMKDGKREMLSSTRKASYDQLQKAKRHDNSGDLDYVLGIGSVVNKEKGYNTNMSFSTAVNPDAREDYIAKQQSGKGIMIFGIMVVGLVLILGMYLISKVNKKKIHFENIEKR